MSLDYVSISAALRSCSWRQIVEINQIVSISTFQTNEKAQLIFSSLEQIGIYSSITHESLRSRVTLSTDSYRELSEILINVNIRCRLSLLTPYLHKALGTELSERKKQFIHLQIKDLWEQGVFKIESLIKDPNLDKFKITLSQLLPLCQGDYRNIIQDILNTIDHAIQIKNFFVYFSANLSQQVFDFESLEVIRTHPALKTLTNEKNQTLVHLAIFNHTPVDYLEALIGTGVPYDTLDANQETPLVMAVRLQDEFSARKLLAFGASLSSCTGFTPLMMSANINCLVMTSFLLRQRACPNLGTFKLPLHFALDHGNRELIELLMLYQADPFCTSSTSPCPFEYGYQNHDQTLLSAMREQGNSFAHMAAKKGNSSALLTIRKYESLSEINDAGETPLSLAMREGHLECINILISFTTPPLDEIFLHASRFANGNVIDLVYKFGGDFQSPNADGETPLTLLLQRVDAIEVLTTLIKKDYKHILTQHLLSKSPCVVKGYSLTIIEYFGAILSSLSYDANQLIHVVAESAHSQNQQAFYENLLEASALYPLLEKILEIVVIKRIKACWIDSREDFHQALLTSPLVFSPTALDAGQFIVHSHKRDFIFTKRDIFRWAVECAFDLKAMLRQCEEEHLFMMQPNTGSYELLVDLEQKDIIQDLLSLHQIFSEDIFTSMKIVMKGKENDIVDSGGPSRQFFSSFFSRICDYFNFHRNDHGLYTPLIKESNTGEFEPLEDQVKGFYGLLGHIMMFCYNSRCQDIDEPGESAHAFYNSSLQTPYPIGLIFSDMFFYLLKNIPLAYLRVNFSQIDFHEPTTFETFRSLLEYSTKVDDQQMLEFLKVNDFSSDDVFENIKATFQAEQGFMDIFQQEEDRTSRLLDFLKNQFIIRHIKPLIEPHHAIFSGMRFSHFGSIRSFETLRSLPWEETRDVLQGSLSKATVIQQLNLMIKDEIIHSNFLRWVHELDLPMLKKFLFAVSGSTTMGPDVIIHIHDTLEDRIIFYTCYYRVIIPKDLQNYEEFKFQIEATIIEFNENPNFNTRELQQDPPPLPLTELMS